MTLSAARAGTGAADLITLCRNLRSAASPCTTAMTWLSRPAPGQLIPAKAKFLPHRNRSTKDHHEQSTADPMCV
jgi:hypothetical protein